MKKPSIPRKWLYFIAGTVWIAVGIYLGVRAYLWLAGYEINRSIWIFLLGLILALIFYYSSFIKVAKKNIKRISSLPQSVCIFAFTAWKGYVIIAIMITLGILLRTSSFPKNYIAVLYIAMSGSLILGSVLFYIKFLKG